MLAGRNQLSHGFAFLVFANCNQFGCDVLRSIWRFVCPVAMNRVQTLLKAKSEAIKEGATEKDLLNATLKPKIRTVLNATAEQVASWLTDSPLLHYRWARRPRVSRLYLK